jgi:hypothetical protein
MTGVACCFLTEPSEAGMYSIGDYFVECPIERIEADSVWTAGVCTAAI